MTKNMAITADYDNMSFTDLLAYKAKEQKDRVFIVESDKWWTWGDIDLISRRIGHDLVAMGCKKGSHIALCGANSVYWICAFFAIERIGGVALLVNPTMLAADIGKVAATGDAAFMICGMMREAKERDPFLDDISAASNISLENFYDISDPGVIERCGKSAKGSCDETLVNMRCEPDDVALMIFTSGSTGSAKGVLHSATNILSASWINCIDQRLNSDDRTCLILPLFHIFGLIAGLFANAVADGTIYIPENLHVKTLIDLMDKEKITVFHSVPTMLIAIMNNEDFLPERLGSLRNTIISGAAATKEQMEMFQKALPNDVFRSSYGLSEMAPVTITKYDDDSQRIRTTVGRPVRDIYIKIADPESGRECAQGVPGEILVKGHRLMTAYYKLPAGEQPFDGEGWLHTGDIGYINSDGYVCLSGRIKELIIRGGENIMPSMVENAISEYDNIANVKVVGVYSEFYGEEVAACVIPKDAAAFDPAFLREALKKKLARYMMPSFIEVYDAFPTLASGKIDRIGLRKDAEKRLGITRGLQNM